MKPHQEINRTFHYTATRIACSWDLGSCTSS